MLGKIRLLILNWIKSMDLPLNNLFFLSVFPNVHKNLGPEMKSTGESILFIDDLKDDDFYEIYSKEMYLTK